MHVIDCLFLFFLYQSLQLVDDGVAFQIKVGQFDKGFLKQERQRSCQAKSLSIVQTQSQSVRMLLRDTTVSSDKSTHCY